MRARIVIMRGPADPRCPRISVGGSAEMGFYCIFRGSAVACMEALKQALRAMEDAGPKAEAMAVDRRLPEIEPR